jgi:hypothetical protein
MPTRASKAEMAATEKRRLSEITSKMKTQLWERTWPLSTQHEEAGAATLAREKGDVKARANFPKDEAPDPSSRSQP